MPDPFDVMRVELKSKAKAKALDLAEKTGKSPNYLTNMLWETIDTFELEEFVKFSLNIKNEKGEIKRVCARRPMKITVKL